MHRISQVKTDKEDEETIEKALLKKLNIKEKDLLSWHIHRKSVDARNRQVLFSFIVDAELRKGTRYRKSKDITETPDETYRFVPEGTEPLHDRPIVAGYGPAGMFAALLLAQNGYRPLILERGRKISQRKADVDAYWQTGKLDPASNVQFGEGGAGAFSDGKLTTRSKDKRVRKVLEELVHFGGQPDILIDAYPHIGTDVFHTILEAMRQELISLGAEFRFESELLDLEVKEDQLEAVLVRDGKTGETVRIPCQALILALGHSAGRTFRTLHETGLAMEPKPFQVGVRIEHPQTFINEAMLHEQKDDPRLIPARYALTAMADNRKGIYTFCMCPGGYVIPSASEPGQLVVNGMSYSDRAADNANSALLVQVNESDYGPGLFAGLDYQEELERKAWEYGRDWRAPAQNARDYLAGKVSDAFLTAPTYALGVVPANLNTLFSQPVNDALHQGLEAFEKKVPGFLDGVLVGVESRASSALRIVRDRQELVSSIAGVYPAGEGSGHAGGIMTSAIDGMKCAEALMNRFKKE